MGSHKMTWVFSCCVTASWVARGNLHDTPHNTRSTLRTHNHPLSHYRCILATVRIYWYHVATPEWPSTPFVRRRIRTHIGCTQPHLFCLCVFHVDPCGTQKNDQKQREVQPYQPFQMSGRSPTWYHLAPLDDPDPSGKV